MNNMEEWNYRCVMLKRDKEGIVRYTLEELYYKTSIYGAFLYDVIKRYTIFKHIYIFGRRFRIPIYTIRTNYCKGNHFCYDNGDKSFILKAIDKFKKVTKYLNYGKL